ncbi:MAG: tRNA pseudouridine55 synthase [Nonlabens sp.]|jgi:tRNA pseudouridine55 synthase|uniref:tRNA pseudouridine(55) synthase TruB n=1 Tax=Nonlabens sp. MB-3u-79 TaxID=2058134 RepID=UPI000C3010E7|nr:tRNA pseudouridine(55) synthase TruB [Nonlabens sp. MB-3u-79]AUC78732.1 tRNA pseudouridine(55) synthase TruB [Nonlabens sp. MB-3u-79]|tara:strand:- start:4371 stop:5078 length:708 start_codon:yes stop_codon:yes gene_type:complete
MQDQENPYLKGQVLLIDKPLEWSSFQVVNKLRWLIRKEYKIKKIKVGHAGTLDPLASGLLIICTGKETKNISTYQAQEKEYTGTITLGGTTPSYDLETEIDQTFSLDQLTEELIKETTAQFTGEIQQKPPIFSAIKKDGKRLYELARAGETTEIEARTVTVNEFEITRIELPEVDFRISCSKGTYIRSIAHDFGAALNNGGHLSSLRRTAIGNYRVENAMSIESFEKLVKADAQE